MSKTKTCETITLTNNSNSKNTYFMTLMVNVKNNNVLNIIDSGFQNIYASKMVVENLDLVSKQKIKIIL